MDYLELENEILEIITNKNYEKLITLKHHNTTRLIHSLNVTLCCYKFAKKLNINIDYKSLIRGCLLHDFYLYEQKGCPSKENHLFYHPKEAIKNAKEFFEVNEIEEEIILKHMFPFASFPKYKETWIIIVCDKHCAVMEKFFNKNYTLEIYNRNKKLRNLSKNKYMAKYA